MRLNLATLTKPNIAECIVADVAKTSRKSTSFNNVQLKAIDK